MDRSGTIPLDSDLLRAMDLPRMDEQTDKNGRGRVLAVGGSRMVPGGIQLTAEAALRAGAGKVQVAVPRSLAVPLGIALPEMALIGLDETADGEIASCAALVPMLERCDAVVIGPAMSDAAAGDRVVATLRDELPAAATLVLDASALHRIEGRLPERSILTPHVGEMAALMRCEADTVETDRPAMVRRAAERFGAVVVLKGATTLVAAPDGRLHAYAGGGVGLATGGSGDVQAGLAAGLAARGADPLTAAIWAVWLHGEAGRRCAEQIGPLGFLARELLAHVPALLRAI